MVRNVVENEDSIVIDVTDLIKYIISNISSINVCSYTIVGNCAHDACHGY